MPVCICRCVFVLAQLCYILFTYLINMLYASLLSGTVKGSVFDLRFSSDNNVNGSGFYATYQVFETTPNSSVLLPAGSGIQG